MLASFNSDLSPNKALVMIRKEFDQMIRTHEMKDISPPDEGFSKPNLLVKWKETFVFIF